MFFSRRKVTVATISVTLALSMLAIENNAVKLSPNVLAKVGNKDITFTVKRPNSNHVWVDFIDENGKIIPESPKDMVTKKTNEGFDHYFSIVDEQMEEGSNVFNIVSYDDNSVTPTDIQHFELVKNGKNVKIKRLTNGEYTQRFQLKDKQM